MKKLYTTLAAAFCAILTVSAADQVQLQLSKADGFTQASPKTIIEKSLNRSGIVDGKAQGMMKSAAKAPEATDWKSIGKGTYLEDLLTYYNDITPNQAWEVDIETSESNPGWYRLIPYASGPVSELLEMADDNYMYINASDPKKVYAEDFTPFGAFLVSNLVPENEWPEDYQEYGTLADGVISFPVESWAIQTSNGFTYTARNTGVKIFLPGTKYNDYYFNVSSKLCSDEDVAYCLIKAGADVAAVKGAVLKGHYLVEGNEAYLAEKGQSFRTTATAISFQPSAPGLYSFIFVALDAENNVIGTGQAYTIWTDNNDEDWADVGSLKFNEGIYTPGYGFDPEDLTVNFQENVKTPGYFRIPDAFSSHSQIDAVNHTKHKHYLYINASDPEYVFIEPSLTGADAGNGLGAIFSRGWLFAGTENQAAAKQAGFCGVYDKDKKTITFPANDMLLAEEYWQNGQFLQGSDAMTFNLDNYNAVSDIMGSEAEGEAEYFNLQGVRIANPAAGQLVIKRQGSKVSKELVR